VDVAFHTKRRGASVSRGATQLFSQTIGGTATFTQLLSLAAGEFLDFAVAAGPNSYFNDNKLLSVSITSVPETSIALMLVLGLAAILHRRQAVRSV
jgi:hypothetical protein